MPLLSPPQTPALFGAAIFGGARFGYAPAPLDIANTTWTSVDPDSSVPDTIWTITHEHDP